MNKTKIIITGISVIILIGLILWFSSGGNDKISSGDKPIKTEDVANISGPDDFTDLFSDPEGLFYFYHPKGFKNRMMTLEDRRVVIIEGSDSTVGLQVVISSFGKDTLSLGDVAEMMSSINVSDIRDLTVAYEAKGFIFYSSNPYFGDEGSIEAWFVYDGNLYQVSSYRKNRELVLDILSNWKFAKTLSNRGSYQPFPL